MWPRSRSGSDGTQAWATQHASRSSASAPATHASSAPASKSQNRTPKALLLSLGFTTQRVA